MAAPKPSRFFPQLGETEPRGTSAFLDARQVSMRENKTCGFLEVQVEENAHVLLLFAQGVLAGTYLLKDDVSQPLQLMNLPAVWDGKPAPVREVELPPLAGRTMWLALESQVRERADSLDKQSLEARLNQWAEEKFSGAVEVFAGEAQGVFYVYQGVPLDSEAFFFEAGEFEPLPAHRKLRDGVPATVVARQSAPVCQSQQCFTLRQASVQWGNGVLRRYKELVGQKMITLAQKDLEDLTSPWGWRIFIKDAELRDEHFFAYAHAAAQAYRAVFMELGSQMEQVIGGSLTQRVLNETFEPLDANLRAALELHRLIPAAFCE